MTFCNAGVPFLGAFLHRVMVIVWVNVDQIIPTSSIVGAVNGVFGPGAIPGLSKEQIRRIIILHLQLLLSL